MDVFKTSKKDLFISESPLTTAQEQFLYDLNSCCLCGTDLVFDQATDFIGQKVVEEVHCPQCQVRHKKESFTLQ